MAARIYCIYNKLTEMNMYDFNCLSQSVRVDRSGTTKSLAKISKINDLFGEHPKIIFHRTLDFNSVKTKLFF